MPFDDPYDDDEVEARKDEILGDFLAQGGVSGLGGLNFAGLTGAAPAARAAAPAEDKTAVLSALLEDPHAAYQLGMNAPQAAAPAPAAPAPTPAAPSPEPAPDMAAATAYGDELEKRRQTAQAQQLQAATEPEPSSNWGDKIGTFLGDNAVGILGTLLDAGLNKGRGIPQILGANAANQDRAIAQRRADEDRAMDFQLQAQRQRQQASAADRKDAFAQASAGREAEYKKALQEHWKAQEGANTERLQLGKDRNARQAAIFEIENNPDNPSVVKLKSALIAGGADPAGLEGATLRTLKTNPAYKLQIEQFYKEQGIPIAARQAAATSGAATAARIGTEVAMTPQIAGSEGVIAEARSKGVQVGQEAGKADANMLIDADRLLEANPQLTAADPTLVQQAVNKGTKDVISQVQSAGRSANIIQGMYDIKHKFNGLPGAVRRGEMSIADAAAAAAALSTEWHGHAEEFAGAMQKIAGTSSEGGKRSAMDLVPSLYSPFGDDRLMGLWGTINENIKSNLGVYSITATPPAFMSTPEAQRIHGLGGGGHAAPHAPAPRPARPRAPKATPAAAPAAPQAAPPSSDMVRMRNPATGNTGYVKRERVQAKVAEGYEVIQ